MLARGTSVFHNDVVMNHEPTQQTTERPTFTFADELDETDKAYAKHHGLTLEDMWYFKNDMCIEAETERLNKIENAIRDAYPIVD